MDADEDEVAVVNQESKPTDEGKTWADIIPETERKKLEEEEEQKKQLEMYLPPRNRKTVKKVSLSVSIYIRRTCSQGADRRGGSAGLKPRPWHKTGLVGD